VQKRNASQNDLKGSDRFRPLTPEEVDRSLRKTLRERRAANPDAKQLINEFELAEQLGFSVGTVRRWRLFARGPRFIKVGGTAVRYARADVEAWLAAQPVGGDAACQKG